MGGEGEISEEGGEDLEDISWEDAAADLEKQREMLKAAAAGGNEEAAPAFPMAGAGAADETVAEAPPPQNEVIPANMERILDLPLKVTVELGRTKMLINDLLQLGQGSVIELTKLVGESLEVLVNDKQVAKGEVVVINEKFGVRLTTITTPIDRINSLK